jgi:pimeloyl-ACP methyl ester carboxylesterase
MNAGYHLRPLRLATGLHAVHCLPTVDPPRARILMLHGLNAGAWQFEHLQPFFAEHKYESLALDYRGHHGSRAVRALGRVAVSDYVQDALIAADFLGQPIVAGQSMGGLIGLKLAEAGAVSAAVALCSLPPRGVLWRGSRALLTTSLRMLPAVVRGDEVLASRSDLDALIFNRMAAPDRARMYERQVPESSWAGFQIAVGAIAVDASAVRCPVLSVSAEHDRLVAPSVGAAIARKYGGQLVELKDCGHYAPVGERGWQARAEAIVAWLQGLEQES